MNEFRERQREVENPFSSVEADTIKELTRSAEGDDDLARPIASSLI